MNTPAIVVITLLAGMGLYSEASVHAGTSTDETNQLAQKIAARFINADANHDGKLTLQEAQAGMPLVARHFAEMDVQHNGYLTVGEIQQFAAQRRQ